MKKKIFTAILTGAMLCGMLTTPVSAAEPEVRMGDVNFDGAVDIADAQLLLMDFVDRLVQRPGILTDAQRAIGNVDGESEAIFADSKPDPITLNDAQFVLNYYLANLVDATITMEEVVGVTEKYLQAEQAFLEKYKPVWNDKTDRYDFIEREG